MRIACEVFFFFLVERKGCMMVCYHPQSLKSFLGEDKIKEFVNFCLHYIADLDIPVKRWWCFFFLCVLHRRDVVRPVHSMSCVYGLVGAEVHSSSSVTE